MAGKCVMIHNEKGGVGKSTISRLLSILLAQKGNKVCLIDFDENGHVALGLLYDKPEYEKTTFEWLTGQCKFSEVVHRAKVNGEDSNLYFVPSDKMMNKFPAWVEDDRNVPVPLKPTVIKDYLDSLKNVFNYVILDMPPTTTKTVAYAMMGTDFVLIPVDIDLGTAKNTHEYIQLLKPYKVEYGIVPNRYDRNPSKKHAEMLQKMKDVIKAPEEAYFPVIRESSKVPGSMFEETSLTEINTKNAKNVIQDLTEVIDTLEQKIGVVSHV